MEFPQLQPRALNRETVLSGASKIVVAAPSEESGIAEARKLADALRSVVDNVELLIDPDAKTITAASGPVFLIGNLANSLCVKQLYWLFLCLSDRWYPGPGGYEVRTLLDPLGTGHNIIHAGYSDDAGLASAMSILLAKIGSPLPFLSEVQATRFPLPPNEVERIHKEPMPLIDSDMAKSETAVGKLYLGYLSGDRELLRESAKFWEALARYGVPPGDHKIKDMHLRTPCIVSLYRLLEQAGMVEERLRLPALQLIWELAQSDQGICLLEGPTYQNEGYPRQNHGLNPAFGYIMAADYFNRHHPELKEPHRWKEIADGVFSPYNDGSWKPMCDGITHGWWLSQPVMLDYALFEPEHRYLESGGARRAADCVLAVTTNEGWLPSSGDSNILRAFAGPSLRVAAAWYGDGRYLFAHELAPLYRRHHLQAFLVRTFCTDVEPVRPDDCTGLTIVPMDPLVYNVWETNPKLIKEQGRSDKPPHAPIEKCFDKLSFRTGWDPDDEFLLIDGLGHFSHSYADAMELILYARYGLSFIVSEHGIQYPEPENHSMVTITRDGEMGDIPGWAEILKAEYDAEGNGYVSLRLEDFAGADWVREVHFRPGVGVVINDTITATKPGQYSIKTHLRVPGHASLEDNTLVSHRQSPTAGAVEFRLSGLSSEGTAFRVDEQDLSLWHRTRPGLSEIPPESCSVTAWRRRYHIEETCLSIFSGRIALALEPGESVSFTQFAQALGKNDAQYEIVPEEGAVTLSGNGQSWKLPLSGRGERKKSSDSAPAGGGVHLETTEVVSFDAAINSMAPAVEGRLVCGLQNGVVALLDGSGRIDWEKQVEAPVHDVAALAVEGQQMYFVGHGKTGLTALNERGETVWARQIERDPTSCAWWELNYASAIQVKAFNAGGSAMIAVGCGDLQVRGFNTEGENLWGFLYENGVPARIRTHDVDGDGLPEIVVGGEIISNQATCRILTHEGRLKYELPIEGWTSKLTSVAYAKVKGRSLLACGASRGRNLHLYDLTVDSDERIPHHLLEKKLGGAVTGVGLFPDEEMVVAGTSQGFITAFNFDGGTRWIKLLDNGVTLLTVLGEHIVAFENDGRYWVFSKKGESLSGGKTGSPVGPWLVDNDSGAIMLASDGRLLRLST